MANPFAGRTLAHYRIEQRLGSGGMGVVYSALDLRLDRRVAIKILTGDHAGRDRLLHEARAASALTHPHVAAIHAIEEVEVEAERVAFIVMEYVEGQALSAVLARGRLEDAALVRYGVQIADAVAHAHRHRVIHCDPVAADVAGIRHASRPPAVSGGAGAHYHAAAVGPLTAARITSGS